MKMITPPKGIQRNNIKGAELLDFLLEEATIESDLEEDGANDTDQSISENEEGNAESTPVIPAPTPDDEIIKSKRIASSQNICDDPSINNDAKSLDAIHLCVRRT